MSKIKELDQAVLLKDLPEHGLRSGDIGTIVLIHNRGEGYEVEFMTLDGETVAVTTLMANELRSITSREIAHVRPIG